MADNTKNSDPSSALLIRNNSIFFLTKKLTGGSRMHAESVTKQTVLQEPT